MHIVPVGHWTVESCLASSILPPAFFHAMSVFLLCSVPSLGSPFCCLTAWSVISPRISFLECVGTQNRFQNTFVHVENRRQFLRIQVKSFIWTFRFTMLNSSFVAMALERTTAKDCGNVYVLVLPKKPSRQNVFKAKIKMLPAFFLILPWGMHSF